MAATNYININMVGGKVICTLLLDVYPKKHILAG